MARWWAGFPWRHKWLLAVLAGVWLLIEVRPAVLRWWGWLAWPLVVLAGALLADQLMQSGWRPRYFHWPWYRLKVPELVGMFVVPAVITWVTPPFAGRTALLTVQAGLLLTCVISNAGTLATRRTERLAVTAPLWCLTNHDVYARYARHGLYEPVVVRDVAHQFTLEHLATLERSRPDTANLVTEFVKWQRNEIYGNDTTIDPDIVVTAAVLRPDLALDRNKRWNAKHVMRAKALPADSPESPLRYLAFDGTGPDPDAPLERVPNASPDRLSDQELDALAGWWPYSVFHRAHATLRDAVDESYADRTPDTLVPRYSKEKAATTIVTAFSEEVRTRSNELSLPSLAPSDLADLMEWDRIGLMRTLRRGTSPAGIRTGEDWRILCGRWCAEVPPLMQLIGRLRYEGHPDLPPAAQWYAAGISAEEAERLVLAGRIPDSETLAAMAALRHDG